MNLLKDASVTLSLNAFDMLRKDSEDLRKLRYALRECIEINNYEFQERLLELENDYANNVLNDDEYEKKYKEIENLVKIEINKVRIEEILLDLIGEEPGELEQYEKVYKEE